MHGTDLVLRNFFKHKDFLPPPEELPGTLFSPLQIIFCLLCVAFILVACFWCAKQREAVQKRIFLILWSIMMVTEVIISVYDVAGGAELHYEWNKVLPFWPCSIYLYTLPFAIFCRGNIRHAACGYICTLGLLGGMINFFYPANYISVYSCISFAGLRTLFYHGVMIFTALTMLLSGYHSFRGVTRLRQVLLPFVPTLLVSIPANFLNLLLPETDYLFLNLDSFFFAPLGRVLPYLVSALLTYLIYFVIHCAPYLPSYIANRRAARTGAPTDDTAAQPTPADAPAEITADLPS